MTNDKIETLIDKYWDNFLGEYYKQKCSGCGHHNSMWATIIESPQWKEWKKVGQYDFSECEELGIMSEGHFQAFLKYLKEEFLKKILLDEKNRIWNEIGKLTVDNPCEWVEKSKKIIFTNAEKDGVTLIK